MNKKLWTIIVSVLLIVTMSVCLFACSDADTNTAEEAKSKVNYYNSDSSNANGAKGVEIGTNTTITLKSAVDMSVENVIAGFTFTDKNGKAVNVRGVYQNGTRTFDIKAPEGGYATGWYKLVLTNSNLSFAQFPGYKKLSISVVDGDDVSAALAENVVTLAAGSAAIYDFSAEDAKMSTFKFDATIAGQMIKMGDVVLVQDENDNYAAYKIWGVEETDEAGVYTVAYQVPEYDEVYDSYAASSSAELTDGTVTYANKTEAADALVNEISAAGFDVGPVRVDANLNGDTVELSIKVTVKDVLGDKDGDNNLNLIFQFDIASKVTADTNINIGALLKKEDNDVTINAVFDNTLTFTVKAQDGMTVTESPALDEVILKIKNLIQNTDDAALSVPVFNWIVPIGGGVADVNFQVNAVLDFSFSGEIGVKSTSTASFGAEVKYNPATDEKYADVKQLKKLSIDSVEVDLDANAAIYVGIEAAIKFELLAGVISVGVGAEVGNYNRIYGSVHTSNLKAYDGVNYGFYFEGGIYYDVKFLYSIAKIKTGSISFLGGRKEKQLYDAGSQYVVLGLYDSNMTLTNEAQDITIDCIYRNIVTGELVTDRTNIIDATKITEKWEDTSSSTNNYVEIKDGKIYLTEAGVAAAPSNYEVRVIADGKEASIIINTVELGNAAQNSIVTGIDGVASAKVVTAEYTDGTVLEVTGTGAGTSFTTKGAGIIVVKADGKVVAMYKVA